jgi:hypothetical protein
MRLFGRTPCSCHDLLGSRYTYSIKRWRNLHGQQLMHSVSMFAAPIVLITPNCTIIFSGVCLEQKKLGSEIFEDYVVISCIIFTDIKAADHPTFHVPVPHLIMRPVVEDRLGNESIKPYATLITGSFMDPCVSRLFGKKAVIITHIPVFVVVVASVHDSTST